ncbi:MAG: malonate transporter, partial [Caballeronia mineralivorans]|nr:malonate transporter [Caballeronia mineralivorans]
LLEIGRYDTSHNVRTAALVRQVATNPVILATIFGLLWSILGSELSGPVASFLTMLGEALTPCALFAIGLDLTLAELRERLGLYALLTALKLAIMPLVVYALCLAADLDRTATIASVVCSAVPTAKSAYEPVHLQRLGAASRCHARYQRRAVLQGCGSYPGGR